LPMLNLGDPTSLGDQYALENGGFDEVEHTAEGVAYLRSRLIHTTGDKTEIYVTKACGYTTGVTPKQVFDTYWNLQLKWDATTVSDMRVLQDSVSTQIVHYQHKTLSAASAKKDLVVQRSYSQQHNGYTCYAYSLESSLMPVQKQFGRANLLFHKCSILETSPGKVEVTFVWCLDFNGWLHVKFLDAEKTKVAMRVSRIIKNTPGASLDSSTPTPTPTLTKAPSTNYAQYTASMRAAETAAAPAAPVYSSPVYSSPQVYSSPVASSGSKVCPSCRTAVSGNFCSTCGGKAVESAGSACPGCNAPIGDGRFCASCGYKVR